MKCPKCGHIKVYAKCFALINVTYDLTADRIEEFDYDSIVEDGFDETIGCCNCGHVGTWTDFSCFDD